MLPPLAVSGTAPSFSAAPEIQKPALVSPGPGQAFAQPVSIGLGLDMSVRGSCSWRLVVEAWILAVEGP